MFKFSDTDHPALPVVLMMITVVCYSAFPALYAHGNAEESPFLFTGTRQIGTGIAMISFVLFVNGDFLLGREMGKYIASRRTIRLTLASIIGAVGSGLFAVAISFVDISIAAILFETWPFFLIPIMAFLFRDSERYRPNLAGTLVFVMPAVAGVALVTLSQNDTHNVLPTLGDVFSVSRTSFGVLLALLSAIFAAVFAACTLKLGESIADNHQNSKRGGIEEVSAAVVMTSVCLILAGGASSTIGLIRSETISLHQLTYAIIGGVVLNSIGVVTFRVANLKTDNLGVNVLAFATPLVALMWLWVLGLLNVARPDHLFIGAMGIVVANLLINIDASRRFASKALVLSLWTFGTIAYLTEGYATDVPLELPVTVFILVLSFRVDRLVRRTGHEEEWVFEAYHKLKILEKNEAKQFSRGWKAVRVASRKLKGIDSYKNTKGLTMAYEDTLTCLEYADADQVPNRELMDIRRLVDNLAHSRHQGSRFGEFVAIALTGWLILTGLLVFSGNRDLYGEIISFLLSSVVVFLIFNIVDLQKDRRDETLKFKAGRHVVNFEGVGDKETQQYVSLGISVLIVAAFVALFFTKT